MCVSRNLLGTTEPRLVRSMRLDHYPEVTLALYHLGFVFYRAYFGEHDFRIKANTDRDAKRQLMRLLNSSYPKPSFQETDHACGH